MREPTTERRAANERMLEQCYDELRALARRRIQRLPPGQTLQATALVHEAYMKALPGLSSCQERAHFFAAVCQGMRDIVVDQVRRKQRVKHGGDRARVELPDMELIGVAPPGEDVLEIDRALTRLEAVHEQEALLVKMRFFAGLSMGEISEMLSIPERTVSRRWRFARAWLRRDLETRTGSAGILADPGPGSRE